MNNRRSFSLAISICFLASTFAWSALAISGSSSKITIDGNMPLTGPMAVCYGDYPKAFLMGIDDACKQFSVPRDVFMVDFQDNTGKTAQGVSIMRKQMLDLPTVYMSGPSPISLAIAREISDQDVLHSIVAFDAYICRNGANRIRILPHYKIEGPVYVDYAKKIKAKRVFILLNTNQAKNDEFEKIVQPGLTKLGMQIHREDFALDNKDYKSLVLKVAQFKPDLILINAWSFHIYPILGTLRDYNLIKNDNVLCTMDFIDLLHNRTPRSELVGVPFITPQYEINASSEKKNWDNRFAQLYKRSPSFNEAYAYDAARIFVATYKKYGKVDTQSIRKVLPFHGICGDITIDQDGDLDTKLAVAKVMSDGTVRVVK